MINQQRDWQRAAQEHEQLEWERDRERDRAEQYEDDLRRAKASYRSEVQAWREDYSAVLYDRNELLKVLKSIVLVPEFHGDDTVVLEMLRIANEAIEKASQP